MSEKNFKDFETALKTKLSLAREFADTVSDFAFQQGYRDVDPKDVIKFLIGNEEPTPQPRTNRPKICWGQNEVPTATSQALGEEEDSFLKPRGPGE